MSLSSKLTHSQLTELKRKQILSLKIPSCVGGYFDLIRVPHGHIPVGKVFWLWRKKKIQVREIRGYDYFSCPVCSTPNFYRACSYHNYYRTGLYRAFMKKVENLFLPLLILFGKAWFVASNRFWSSVRVEDGKNGKTK